MSNSNSISRALIEISKANGWDSTRIWDQEKGAYGESMLAWDHPREPFDPGLGNVPGGVPAHDQKVDTSGGPKMTEEITWNYPDVSHESKENGRPKMTLSDPTPGNTMPGA